MGVADHLNIRIEEYDARIRSFIPNYARMLDEAAGSLRALPRRDGISVVELGIGTGALARRCLEVIPGAQLTGIDADAEILNVARARLGGTPASPAFLQQSFLDDNLPTCDAVVASLALHHVADADDKTALYRRIRLALRDGGLFVSADCFPSSDPVLAAHAMERWRDHLRRSYAETEIEGYFRAWAAEDTYFSLDAEFAMRREAGFIPDVVWRADPMAVVVARAV